MLFRVRGNYLAVCPDHNPESDKNRVKVKYVQKWIRDIWANRSCPLACKRRNKLTGALYLNIYNKGNNE